MRLANWELGKPRVTHSWCNDTQLLAKRQVAGVAIGKLMKLFFFRSIFSADSEEKLMLIASQYFGAI